jgi:hypothetical protein
MRANAEVLILEDDSETLEDLRIHFSRKHFHPAGGPQRRARRGAAAQQRRVDTPGARGRRLGSVQGC